MYVLYVYICMLYMKQEKIKVNAVKLEKFTRGRMRIVCVYCYYTLTQSLNDAIHDLLYKERQHQRIHATRNLIVIWRTCICIHARTSDAAVRRQYKRWHGGGALSIYLYTIYTKGNI